MSPQLVLWVLVADLAMLSVLGVLATVWWVVVVATSGKRR